MKVQTPFVFLVPLVDFAAAAAITHLDQAAGQGLLPRAAPEQCTLREVIEVYNTLTSVQASGFCSQYLSITASAITG